MTTPLNWREHMTDEEAREVSRLDPMITHHRQEASKLTFEKEIIRRGLGNAIHSLGASLKDWRNYLDKDERPHVEGLECLIYANRQWATEHTAQRELIRRRVTGRTRQKMRKEVKG